MLAESGIWSLSADCFDLDVGDLGYLILTHGDPAARAAITDRYGLSPAGLDRFGGFLDRHS